jgi:hypothetical protein
VVTIIFLEALRKKNKDTFNERWPFLFNAIIDGLNLRELEIYGRKFTRTNNLQNPTYGNLDRVLMSSGWEQKFPLSMMDALPREISDHTPLFLNIGESSSESNQTQFKFELGWLLRDGFIEMIKELWTNTNVECSRMEIW